MQHDRYDGRVEKRRAFDGQINPVRYFRLVPVTEPAQRAVRGKRRVVRVVLRRLGNLNASPVLKSRELYH